jgi:hypothetical protein
MRPVPFILALFFLHQASAAVPLVPSVESQPFRAQIRRVLEALDSSGSPLLEKDRAEVDRFLATDSPGGVTNVQSILDRHCLFDVLINPEMRVKVAAGPAKPELDEQGWRVFLVKVRNESGATQPLKVESPNAGSLAGSTAAEVPDRWLAVSLFENGSFKPALSGLEVEYRLIQLYSRDAGKREAKFAFNAGQGSQDLGFRSEADILFTARSAREIVLRVSDEHGKPTTAAFVIRDPQKRVYPAQSKRLAPDFSFHPQVYRADGETIRLPDGDYTVEFSRGPESLAQTRNVSIGSTTRELAFRVERWIDPSTLGWWSGDHHIHAAGCAHYVKPTEGVFARDMMRHCLGEDLKIGANLTWGPCFDFQKQFFCGAIDPVSKYPYLLRYDVEVSGFGSHQSGHLVLLRLKDQIYPGGTSKDHWPTLGLNTLKWAKKQGAVVGPAHSGWGLEVDTAELPNYVVPPYSGIGANEYVVDVTHEIPGPDGKAVPAVDFISTVDTPCVWELNMWYHTLNAGFRTRISGETDFPCIYGERVGLGRSYVHLEGALDYDTWCEGIREGRNYVSDGRSHILDFKVNQLAMGERGSELRLREPGKIRATATVAALLPEKPDAAKRHLKPGDRPYWDLERARVGDSREVPVELVVNGEVAAKTMVIADGKPRPVSFETEIKQSGWVAVRILAASHTNPIFVLVNEKPIRASKRSIEWCLKGVDRCWSQKRRFIQANEMADAESAYDHAREIYKQRLAECVVE